MSIYDTMTVTVPEGELDGLRVEKFTVLDQSVENFRNSLDGRGTKPGTYTKLCTGTTLWMSDTDAEKRDHFEAVRKFNDPWCERVLINGLGLGMVLSAALSLDDIEHVDVVEKDERVIQLVGSHYTKDSRVTIHHADAYEQAKKWPAGTSWDVAWHDIWPSLCTDNLKDMTRLHRSYGRRVQWQGSWGKKGLESIKRQEQRNPYGRGSYRGFW